MFDLGLFWDIYVLALIFNVWLIECKHAIIESYKLMYKQIYPVFKVLRVIEKFSISMTFTKRRFLWYREIESGKSISKKKFLRQ